MIFDIDEKDFIDNKYCLSGEQLKLQILKNKGAPIMGGVLLKADTENYHWSRKKFTGFERYYIIEKK